MFLTTAMTQGEPCRDFDELASWCWIMRTILDSGSGLGSDLWQSQTLFFPLCSTCLHWKAFFHPHQCKPILIYPPPLVNGHSGSDFIFPFPFLPSALLQVTASLRTMTPETCVFSSRYAAVTCNSLAHCLCWLSKHLPLKLETSVERPGATVVVWRLNSPFILINNCFNLRPGPISMGTCHSPWL